MHRISEVKVNNLTSKHISRVLRDIEKDFRVPVAVKRLIKKEFWLFNQGLKEELFKNDIIELDEKERPWFPNMGTKILCTPPGAEEQV